MNDIRVPMDPIFDAFGVPATVTRPEPNDTPISTAVVWPSGTTEDALGPMDLQRRERRRVVIVRRDQVPSLPSGAFIDAAEYLGGPTKTWRVEGPEHTDQDVGRFVVVEIPDTLGTEPDL